MQAEQADVLDYRGIIVVAMAALLSLPGLLALAGTSSAQRASLLGPTEPLTGTTGLDPDIPSQTDQTSGNESGNDTGNDTSEEDRSSEGDQEADGTQTQETSAEENNSSDENESEELEQTSADDDVTGSPGLAVLVVVFVVAAGGLLLWARM